MRAGGALRRALWPARWFRARARPPRLGLRHLGLTEGACSTCTVNVHCTVHQRSSCTDRDALSALERPRPLVRCEPSFLRMGFGFPSTLGGIFHRHARARRPLPATARAAGGGGAPRRAGAGGRGGGGGAAAAREAEITRRWEKSEGAARPARSAGAQGGRAAAGGRKWSTLGRTALGRALCRERVPLRSRSAARSGRRQHACKYAGAQGGWRAARTGVAAWAGPRV